MRLQRCLVCKMLPYVSTKFDYRLEQYSAQVRCECGHHGETCASRDSKTCVEDAVDSWNQFYSIPYVPRGTK